MRRSESAEAVNTGELSDRSFSSLPVPKSWREDRMTSHSKISDSLSVSVPHLLVLDGTRHSVSLPHLLAIETYYNYPSAASILDETFHDVVDQERIHAEAAKLNSTPHRPRTLKRTLSLKSFRRLRKRILVFAPGLKRFHAWEAMVSDAAFRASKVAACRRRCVVCRDTGAANFASAKHRETNAIEFAHGQVVFVCAASDRDVKDGNRFHSLFSFRVTSTLLRSASFIQA